MLDILTQPELVNSAWEYFRNVQTKELQYKSFLRPEDKPAIWLNKKIMAEYRERMKPFYYDSSKYDTTWISSESSTRLWKRSELFAAMPSASRWAYIRVH